MSRQRDELGLYLTILGFEEEVRFHPTRKWRLDYAFPSLKVGVEYQGIVGASHGYGDVGHASIAGMLRDMEKINEAQCYGWIVLLANAKNVKDGTIFQQIEAAIQSRGGTIP